MRNRSAWSAWLTGSSMAAGVLLASPSVAEVDCGDTIGPREEVKLESDVGPCTDSTDPAVRLVGPATLDLNGFRILCSAGTPPDGVTVEGNKARLMNGSIHDCNDAVNLEGDGGHQVDTVATFDSVNSGIDVNSDKNRLRGVVTKGGKRGINLSFEWERNQVQDSIVVGAEFQGFDLNGDRTKITGNLAVDNGSEGIYCDGDGSKLSKNRAFANDEGIFVASSCTRSSTKSNVALGNNVDMVDEDCGNGNKWSGNLFGTRDGDCVK